MSGSIPSIAMTFSFDGRLFIVSGSTHKISNVERKEFECGFCRTEHAATERYSTLTGQAEDGARVTFMFCSSCVQSALRDFPNLPKPAVERAILAKVERDGALSGSIAGLTDREVEPYLGKRVLVLLTKDNLWPTDDNPDGRIVLTGVLQRSPLIGIGKYEVIADGGTRQMIEDSSGIERIDVAIA